MLLRAKLIITDRGKPRRIMEITESKSDGSLYLKNNSGKQVGLPPNNKLIKEERYSIHPSNKSPLYSTIVNHHNFIDNTNSPPYFHYTNAVKLKTGFTPIIHIRYPDFSTDKYDIGQIKDGVSIIELIDTDLSKCTIYLSIYVGHPETIFFLPSESEIIKKEIVTKEFKLVFLITIIEQPAIPFSFLFNFCSHGGNFFGQGYDPLPQHCQFSTVESCIDSHYSFTEALYREYFESLEVHKNHILNEGIKFYNFNFYKYQMTLKVGDILMRYI